MVASVKWKLLFDKYCHQRQIENVCNISDGALCDNSLQLKAVNFCYKNSILDTSRGLDPTVVKYDFPITVTSHINYYWTELDFCQMKKNLPNTFVIRGNPGPLPWSKMEIFVTFFWQIKAANPFRLSSSSKFNQNFHESM